MIELAKRRVASFPKERSYRHVALVLRGGCVLAVGTNAARHAEVAALSKLFPSERVGTTVISLRIRKDGSLAMARPCNGCMLFLRQSGVKKVEWSDSNGNMIKVRLK